MSQPDLHRVVAASREFIAVLKRHARQYNAPGNDTSHGAIGVLDAGRELHLALEGRTLFDPPKPVDGPPPDVRIFIGPGAMEADRQCGIIRECLRRSLRRVGYRGTQRIEGTPHVDASYGTMPSMEGLEHLPQDGLPELEPLIDATDELEELDKRIEQTAVQPARPADPPPPETAAPLPSGKPTAADLARPPEVIGEPKQPAAGSGETPRVVSGKANDVGASKSADDSPENEPSRPLADTLKRLTGCGLQAKIVRYLWDRGEREAPISQLSKDLYGVSDARLRGRLPSVRRQLERTRDSLERKGCPLRLTISANSVQLTLAAPAE